MSGRVLAAECSDSPNEWNYDMIESLAHCYKMTRTHPSTGLAVYDVYDAADTDRYVHYYDGPMVSRRRVVILEMNGGIGFGVDAVEVSSDIEAEKVIRQALHV